MNAVESVLPVDEAVLELQNAFDQERLVPHLNLVTAKVPCEDTTGTGVTPAKCSHDAVLQFAEMVVCGPCSACGEATGCGHKTKTVRKRICLLHYLRKIEPYVDPQLDMLNPRDQEIARQTAAAVDADAAAAKLTAERAARNGGNGNVHELAKGKYELTPSETDPTLCICGWEIKSPLDPKLHDRRHKQYLAAIETESETPAKSSRKPRAGSKK